MGIRIIFSLFALCAFSEVSQSSQCFYYFSAPTSPSLSPYSSEVWEALKTPQKSGKNIINELSRDSTLKKLFEADAGVSQGYTIREHTLMVLVIFNRQYLKFYSYFKIEPLPNIRLLELFKITIALHDIGKPLAIAAGNKELQHYYTLPILVEQLRKLNFNESEIQLAVNLVGNEVMGSLIRQRIDVPTALIKFQALAHQSGLSLKQYLPLQALFYTADAGSYPELRRYVFSNKDDILLPDRLEFYELILHIL